MQKSVLVQKRVERIEVLILEHGVLNSYQVCRLLNGYGKNEFDPCYWSFKQKPLGSSPPNKRPCRNFQRCDPNVHQVQYAVSKSIKIQSEKRKFWDHGGLKKDTFRFLFIDRCAYEEKILRQTLNPYIV